MDWDFIANAVVDSVDTVPEAYRAHYKPGTGDNANKFVLDDSVKTLAHNYTNLAKKFTGVTKDKKLASDESAKRRHAISNVATILNDFGIEVDLESDEVSDKLKGMLSELAAKAKNGQELTVNIDKIRAEINKKADERVVAKDKELGTMKTSLEKYLIHSAAAVALAEAGTVEKGIDLLMPQIQKFAKVVQNDKGDWVVRVVDADGDVRMGGGGEGLSIKELVSELKQSYPMAFKSEVKSGSGPKKPDLERRPTRGEEEKSAVGKIASGLAKLNK